MYYPEIRFWIEWDWTMDTISKPSRGAGGFTLNQVEGRGETEIKGAFRTKMKEGHASAFTTHPILLLSRSYHWLTFRSVGATARCWTFIVIEHVDITAWLSQLGSASAQSAAGSRGLSASLVLVSSHHLSYASTSVLSRKQATA